MQNSDSGSMWSIPVNKLLPLLNRIKAEMEQCPELTYPPDHRWKAGDPLVWTGFSEPISQFFQLKRIDPRTDERFSEFYDNMEQNLSSSYTWAHTSLQAMADEFQDTKYFGRRVFIDVLLVPQYDIKNDDVFQTTRTNYGNVEVGVFLNNEYLNRGWCLMEASEFMDSLRQLHVIGSCEVKPGTDFFHTMVASKESDVDKIKAAIIADYGARLGISAAEVPAEFNRRIEKSIIRLSGETLLHQGKYSEALSVFQQLLQDAGADATKASGFLMQIGNAQDSLGHYEEAMESCNKALELFLQNNSPTDIFVADVKNILACVQQNLGQYQEALKTHEDALKIKIERHGHGHVSVAATKKNIGIVYMELGKYEEALKMYDEALTIEQQCLGDRHASVADTLFNMSLVHQKLGNSKKQKELQRQAHAIYLQTLGANHPSTKDAAPAWQCCLVS